MKIEKIDDNNFILHGKIKEVSDYYDIKVILEKRKKIPNTEIYFKIPQAKEINFHLLGYWLKLARKNGMKFHFYLSHSHLYDTFVLLGLHQFFEVIDDSVDIRL